MHNKPGETKEDVSLIKNLIVTAHKDVYYVATALILKALKEADIAFTSADTLHTDLTKLHDTPYENIIVVGVRFKNDYAQEIRAAMETLIARKKKIRIYIMEDRFEIKGQEAKFFYPLLKFPDSGKEGERLMDIINALEKPPEADYKRLNALFQILESYEMGKKCKKDEAICDLAEYVDYTVYMYWKWHVGDEAVLKEMIAKLANDTVTKEDIATAKNYDRNNYILTGRSKAITELRKAIATVGKYNDAPVLISGETGTGKEIVARMLHDASDRREKSFIPVNCAGIPSTLMESMLFGAREGAYTDAKKDRKGIFEVANGGTVFLDEITEMPMDVQAKFLRFLEDFKFTPLGTNDVIEADVRILSATNTDIKERIKQGKFRADLYYRISGVELYVPSLRERKEDIREIANVILYRLFREGKYKRHILTKTEVSILESYIWPGNIRQMQKFLMRALIFQAKDKEWKSLLAQMAEKDEPARESMPFNPDTVTTLADAEKWAIRKALKIYEGNKSQAAKGLGVALNTLKNKMKEYGIENGE